MNLNLQQVQQKAKRVLRRKWLQHRLKNVTNNDNHQGLERIYKIRDPWNLDSPREHVRFELTNREIEKHFGKVDSMLELGSSEGLQSSYLSKLCNKLEGVDVSPTAVNRARQRLPDANFYVGDLTSQSWADEENRYDLVVACEVLYYIEDVKTTLRTMNHVGKSCFVTFFTPEAHKLSAIMESIPGVQKNWLSHEGTTWLVAHWRKARELFSAAVAAFIVPFESINTAAGYALTFA